MISYFLQGRINYTGNRPLAIFPSYIHFHPSYPQSRMNVTSFCALAGLFLTFTSIQICFLGLFKATPKIQWVTLAL